MPMDPGPRSRATMRMAAGALELMDANEQDPGTPGTRKLQWLLV